MTNASVVDIVSAKVSVKGLESLFLQFFREAFDERVDVSSGFPLGFTVGSTEKMRTALKSLLLNNPRGPV